MLRSYNKWVVEERKRLVIMEMFKKSRARIFVLKLLVFFIAILPNCRLENKLIEFALMNFSLEENTKVLKAYK